MNDAPPARRKARGRAADARPVVLALGGGGARGLAHIPVLEAFDELGVVPERIAGTSIGAIFGALYASGLSASEIRAAVGDLIVTGNDRFSDVIAWRGWRRWVDLVDPSFRRGGLVKGEGVHAYLTELLRAHDFADLRIQLKIVAADFWTGEEVVLDDGPLVPAIRASMAVPGIFRPVTIAGRTLIDGGVVNPVPYDVWDLKGAFTIAVDVTGSRARGPQPPGAFEALFGAFQIMQSTIISEKLRRAPPDLLVRPETQGVRLFEFHKARTVYEASRPLKDSIKRALEANLAEG